MLTQLFLMLTRSLIKDMWAKNWSTWWYGNVVQPRVRVPGKAALPGCKDVIRAGSADPPDNNLCLYRASADGKEIGEEGEGEA